MPVGLFVGIITIVGGNGLILTKRKREILLAFLF